MPIHLRGTRDDYAPSVLVPGDPRRARTIAETFFDPGYRCVNQERGMLGFTGTYRGKPLSVQAVGMGGPSAAIYYEELIQLGAQRLIRVGTAGGLQTTAGMGATVLALSATADCPVPALLADGHPHAPTATWRLVERATMMARERNLSIHVGPVVTSALFYDTRPGVMERWRDRGHIAVEMEAATLYTLAAVRRIEALAFMTVSDVIVGTGDAVRITDEELAVGVRNMTALACDVAVY
jgi:purine-nucleoside phosphorylase